MKSLKLVPFRARPIPDGVRAAVIRALDGGFPFVMLAKRPDGTWEVSAQYLADLRYEMLGALASYQHELMTGDGED
jgi:hypothetical protein